MFFELSYIPRDLNHLDDSLAILASLFVPPLPPRLSYDAQVKYKTLSARQCKILEGV